MTQKIKVYYCFRTDTTYDNSIPDVLHLYFWSKNRTLPVDTNTNYERQWI